MTPEDPRHGQYAGVQAHWRDGEQLCDPCRVACSRTRKRLRLRHVRNDRPLVPLGEAAHRIVSTAPPTQLRTALGMPSARFSRYVAGGPDMLVRRTTRDRILTFRRQWTAVGVQRRLRALTLLGWSMSALEEETGLSASGLARLRGKDHIHYVQATTAAAIVEAYERLHLTPAPPGPSSRRTLSDAHAAGYFAPLAWDDIDTDETPPSAATEEYLDIDIIVVERVLAGELLPGVTRAERVEIVRRWRLTGRPLAQLADLTGWRVERYYDPATPAASALASTITAPTQTARKVA